MQSLIESPAASSNASLNQAFAINPDDLVSEEEEDVKEEAVLIEEEVSPQLRAKRQLSILESLKHERRSNSESTSRRRLLS